MGVIVVATDGSKAASSAVDQAVSLAHALGDTVSAVTVWRALQDDFGLARPAGTRLGALLATERAHADGALEDAVLRGADGGVRVDPHLVAGDPAERICALADDQDARLIVVGTRGHGAVSTLLLGSVCDAVIRRAGRPVLVVRTPPDEPARSAEAGTSAEAPPGNEELARPAGGSTAVTELAHTNRKEIVG